jgi:uracil-DNA glycosylase
VGAEQLLRRYLEQRKELGETDLVLDRMTVDEVMRLIGAAPRSEQPQPAPPATPGAERVAAEEHGDWRAALRAAGAAPSELSTHNVSVGRAREERPVPRESESPPPPEPAPSKPAASSAPAPPGLVVGSAAHELFAGPVGTAGSLEEIASMVHACTRCDLYRTATHGVPGEGNPRAELMCVGEAPGASEDASGRPFVGQAGQLLTKILQAINLSRDDVFIANVLKHRPPGNRNPRPDEVEACRPYLVRQIELVRPKVIIAFGSFAAQTLLETKLAIGKLRGAVHRYHGIPVIVTYHPAALLRNPSWKRPTWEDVQLARRLLDNAPA